MGALEWMLRVIIKVNATPLYTWLDIVLTLVKIALIYVLFLQ